MRSCRREPAALERLDCYDRILSPEQPAFGGAALVKAVTGAKHGPAPQSRKNAAGAIPQGCW
ncbi:hypothetical protein ECZU34_38280 [Escherichia coli]|nr:hypothetical protein ECZU34_38280 [Escherichia coli]